MARTLKALAVTIPSGQSMSNPALLGDHVLVGIRMPAAWDAASLTFQISYDNGASWQNLFDDGGNEVTLSPASPAGLYLAVSPDPFGGIILLKVRSGTSATPVNQTATRAMTLIGRKVFSLE